ncbi:MAG: hypothetical protein RCO49_00645 [Rickettsia endosymbiont of Argas persicus]
MNPSLLKDQEGKKYLLRNTYLFLLVEIHLCDRHRQVKRDVNLSIERLKGMIYRIAVTIYQ